MSGRINLSNLSDSLKEHLNGLGLTEEQVNELIENALVEINEKDVEQDDVVNGLVDKIGELNGLMTEEKGNLVGAINELFQSANNGKELIASAIGEPLDSNDTFSAMSNDINSLLSTFKTNMMNNGITVESNDRFKSLIDKIATMVEEGSGKGIQFVTGEFVASTKGNQNVTYDLNFTPNIVFAVIDSCSINSQVKLKPMAITNIQQTNTYSGSVGSYYNNYITDVSSTGFVIKAYVIANSNIKWYAIGVGEEDTTLRDSLASILQEEGVSVTEEDDMASLIGKVDSEFDRQVVPQGNASANQVLQGSTFMNSSGQLQTGTIPYLQSNIPNAPTHYMTGEVQVGDYSGLGGNSVYFAMPTGVYNTVPWLMSYEPDLRPENIVSGVNILGVWGSAGGYNMIPGTKYIMSQGYVDGRSNPTLDMCTVYIKRDGRLTVNITFHGENRNEYIHAYTKDANGNVINTQSYDAGFGASDTYWNGVQVYANTYLNIVIQTNNGWYGKSYHWWYAILFDLE